MSQTEQLEKVVANFSSAPEGIRKQLSDGHAKFMTTWDASKTIRVGDKLPAFTMPDATGKLVSSASLLSSDKGGALLITFYRGEWCPFCNIALSNLQKHLPEFQARGVTLVAVSPELPNNNLSTAEKHALQFPVLTDLHNSYARELGIVYDMSAARDLHKSLGINLQERQGGSVGNGNGDGDGDGDESWDVPIPASFLVDKEGTVRNLRIEPDYWTRLDPKVALEWIDAL